MESARPQRRSRFRKLVSAYLNLQKMNRKIQYLILGSVILCATFCSCKGRHADGTPVGETIEVVVPESETVINDINVNDDTSISGTDSTSVAPAAATAQQPDSVTA